VLICFAFVCVYFVGFSPGPFDANQRSHYQLLRALGERGTAEIGPEVRDLGTHTDVAVYGGRSYSNKAPGLSVAALPAYGILRLFSSAPTSAQDWLVFYGARVLSVTLVVVLALGVFVRCALQISPIPRLLPLWLFALLFATPFQVYSRSFFSHALAAGLLFLSFALLARHDSVAAAAGAGLLAGMAVASEYPAAAIAVCLLIFAALRTSTARLVAFVSGAGVPAALLGWYHAHYFGGLLHFPPAFSQSYPTLAGRGLAGVSWPAPEALLGLFLDGAHGLLYFSPFLILWPVAAVLALRNLRTDLPLLPPAVGPLLLVLLISGFLSPHWRGGWCLGPRYLIAGFLLVFWLLAVRVPVGGGPSARLWLLASVVYATVIVTISGSTFWMIPYEAWNPARTVAAHFLRLGIVEFNLGVAAGLPPLLSLVPPAAATALGFLAAIGGSSFRRRTVAAAILLGLLAAATVLSIKPSPAAVASSHRDGLAPVLRSALRSGWR
jgi:hypothetical protein